MLKISDWMRVLREHLHIAPIEAKVIAIEDAVKNVDVVIAIGQAVLANEQRHLEVISTEIENSVRQLIAVIESERCARKEAEIQIIAAIETMTNEMKRVADIVDQHIRSTHHDHNK